MNTIWHRHAGDTNDYIQVKVTGIADNLDAVTAVSGKVVNQETGAEVALTASIEDSANFLINVDMGTWLQSTAQPGEMWELTVLITASSFGPASWPDTGRALIAIV